MGHYLCRRYQIGSKTWMLSNCIYYRPEYRANGGPLKLDFEGLGMQRLNKPTDRAQRVDEKNMLICLVTMFTSRVMVIKMSNNGLFLYFLLTTAKSCHNLGTEFKCTWKIFLSKHDLDKWHYFFIYYLNSIQGLFYKVRAHACDFSEKEQKNAKKGQRRAKYLKTWAKMYKIWKYFEKRQAIVCNYTTQ